MINQKELIKAEVDNYTQNGEWVIVLETNDSVEIKHKKGYFVNTIISVEKSLWREEEKEIKVLWIKAVDKVRTFEYRDNHKLYIELENKLVHVFSDISGGEKPLMDIGLFDDEDRELNIKTFTQKGQIELLKLFSEFKEKLLSMKEYRLQYMTGVMRVIQKPYQIKADK